MRSLSLTLAAITGFTLLVATPLVVATAADGDSAASQQACDVDYSTEQMPDGSTMTDVQLTCVKDAAHPISVATCVSETSTEMVDGAPTSSMVLTCMRPRVLIAARQ